MTLREPKRQGAKCQRDSLFKSTAQENHMSKKEQRSRVEAGHLCLNGLHVIFVPQRDKVLKKSVELNKHL